jgi:Ca-activated chloride channel homolog
VRTLYYIQEGIFQGDSLLPVILCNFLTQYIRLKNILTILACLLIFSSASAQVYKFVGEVTDVAEHPLMNVTVKLNNGTKTNSSNFGKFSIVSTKRTDTLTFLMDGYDKQIIITNAEGYLVVRLKLLSTSSNTRKYKLSSVTKDLSKESQRQWFTGNETYANTVENRFIPADKFPSTGISLNVDKASYSNIRRFINLKSPVPPEAVRIEEMLNYFNTNYAEPAPGKLFNIQTNLTNCPWNQDNLLYFVNASAKKINTDALPPAHLVFLIDVSGSMDMPNRLPLLKSAFKLLVNNLRNRDTVSLVVYGGISGILLNALSGAEKDSIIKTIDALEPGGSTPGESGIRTAYRVAQNHFIKKGNNRVILATDGDFNVGLKTENELDELISQQRQSGIYLTCLGVGMGNYKDSKIQTLARKGNGNFAYLDNFAEAEKVLMQEFTQTLYSVADDVYMDVKFNADYAKEYRLIGFDNKAGAIADQSSAIEGGEIGSGHTMMAVFEIIPNAAAINNIKKGSLLNDFASLQMKYSLGSNDVQLTDGFAAPVAFTDFSKVNKNIQFQTAVIMFGSVLHGSMFAKNMNWNDIIRIATVATAESSSLIHKEFVSLLVQAKEIYTGGKKKKKHDRPEN